MQSAASFLGFLGVRRGLADAAYYPAGGNFFIHVSITGLCHRCVPWGRGGVRDLLTFAVHALFPQMVAGPIERGRQLIPQLETDLKFAAGDLHEGLVLILVGFFKKVFVADNCALLANYVFESGTKLNGYWAVIGGLAFAFQIYGDFCGYTDIARGAAKTLGINLVQNFHFPYLARNPSDFWSRWHISLSTWFRITLHSIGGQPGQP